jgi:hypothetical protein
MQIARNPPESVLTKANPGGGVLRVGVYGLFLLLGGMVVMAVQQRWDHIPADISRLQRFRLQPWEEVRARHAKTAAFASIGDARDDGKTRTVSLMIQADADFAVAEDYGDVLALPGLAADGQTKAIWVRAADLLKLR